MRTLALLFIGVLFLSATPKKYAVIVELTYSSSYCGGAAPSDELMQELQTQKPWRNKKLYLKKGSKNTLDSKIFREVITDTSGIIKLQLAPGQYFLVDEEKKDKTYYNHVLRTYKERTNEEGPVDMDCFKKWYATPELVLNISIKSPKRYKLNIHHECKWSGKPCIPYFGPIPP